MFFKYGLFLTTLIPGLAFGAGATLNFTSLQAMAPNTPYVGVGQVTREMRSTGKDPVTFIEFELNDKPRRLWDDDGFATLFLYQRALVSRAISDGGKKKNKADSITGESVLPKPTEPLVESINRLHAYYKKLKEEDVRVKEDPEIAELYDDLIKRIGGVASYMKSSKFKQVKDVKESGLEALIADLESNHSYNVETDEDEMINDSIGSLIGDGIPRHIGDPIYARCFDEIALNWMAATKGFSGKGGNGGSGGGDVYMETQGVDTGR